MTAIVQGFVMGLFIGVALAFLLMAMFRGNGSDAPDDYPHEHGDGERE